LFFFSSRRRHTRFSRDWSSDVCSSDLMTQSPEVRQLLPLLPAEDEHLQHSWDYIYEPDDAGELLDGLLTRYIESQVYQGVVENKIGRASCRERGESAVGGARQSSKQTR